MSRWIAVILICLSGLSCAHKTSFPEGTLVPGLKKILKEEFDLPVLVSRKNKTLGVAVTIPKLFTAPGSGWPVAQSLIWQIRHSIHRVLLSTDQEIEFYQLTLRGNNADFELAFIYYLRDYKMFQLGAISRGDYSERQVVKQLANLATGGGKRIRMFFKELGNRKAENIIRTHFSPDVKSENIATEFVSWLWESSMKIDVHHQILSMKMKNLDEKKSLFYLEVRETFGKKHGFEEFPFVVTTGKIRKYLIEIHSPDSYRGYISKLFFSDMESREQKDLYDDILVEQGDPSTWDVMDFHVFEFTFDEFINELISSKIQTLLSERNIEQDPDEATALFPKLAGVRVFTEGNAVVMKFVYRNAQKIIYQEDKNLAIDIAVEILNKYHYKQIQEIMIGTLSGELELIPVKIK